MRLPSAVAALVLAAGCPNSQWKLCDHLEITTRNAANQQRWMRYVDARYKVLDTDPLTVTWEYYSCVDVESETGAVDEVCGRETQTGPVDRVACR